MTNEARDAFKVGFLTKLAELGLTPGEFYKAAAEGKSIFPDLGSVGMGLGGGLLEAGKAGGQGLLALGVGAPLALGGIAGAADAALNAPNGEDIEDLRRAELIGLLRRMTGEVRGRSQRAIQ